MSSSPPTNVADDTQQRQLYPEGAIVTNDYSIMPGVCILPIAEDPPTNDADLKNWSPVIVAKLHAPYRIREHRTSSVKQNNPPVMPSPSDSGVFIFVSGSLSFSNSLNSSFVNYDWGVEANYTFVENCVSRNQDGFVLGIPPYRLPTNVELINANTYTIAPPNDGIGAVAQAGAYVTTGYNQALAVIGSSGTGFTSAAGWGYNTPSYYSGLFFNSELINGGPQPPSTSNPSQNQSQNG